MGFPSASNSACAPWSFSWQELGAIGGGGVQHAARQSGGRTSDGDLGPQRARYRRTGPFCRPTRRLRPAPGWSSPRSYGANEGKKHRQAGICRLAPGRLVALLAGPVNTTLILIQGKSFPPWKTGRSDRAGWPTRVTCKQPPWQLRVPIPQPTTTRIYCAAAAANRQRSTMKSSTPPSHSFLENAGGG